MHEIAAVIVCVQHHEERLEAKMLSKAESTTLKVSSQM